MIALDDHEQSNDRIERGGAQRRLRQILRDENSSFRLRSNEWLCGGLTTRIYFSNTFLTKGMIANVKTIIAKAN